MPRAAFIVGALVALAVMAAAAALWSRTQARLDTPLAPATALAGIPQLADPFRIAFIGTSLTADTSWPSAAAARLQACLGRPVSARVFAKGGATSGWGLSQAEPAGAAPFDLILIEFAINDADLRRGVSLSQSVANHETLISQLRRAQAGAVIAMLRLNRAYGTRGLLRPRLGAYERQLSQLFTSRANGVIDMRPDWAAAIAAAQRAGTLPAVLPDGLHPTDTAALQINAAGVADAVSAAAGRGPCAP
ncbi:MAG: SGNH/GDSL hydrolase family protein [Alphaproteobacteria bacterium]|nr:SGNH/GDSL hydrolase family protein [Alphaproteobacteria bacterium]NNF24955.1 SGNH/GDSL hydrolase family protein [Paracoccaceae bacterium]